MPITFSCIIPASEKDASSQNLKDLIASIRAQDFPQDEIEILVIREGDSEQAKGIGIKRAKGTICAMFCCDNEITEPDLFSRVSRLLNMGFDGIYPEKYHYRRSDNSLNRYFALIGGNDPVCYYLGKNDRWPHVESLAIRSTYQPSYGCNGFFYKASAIKATDLAHYYPMDNASEVAGPIASIESSAIWHKTSDSLISFLKKRYRYAKDLYCDRQDRRWLMVDGKEDKWRLAGFILSTLTVIPCVWLSFRGYSQIKDRAWFWHWPVCFGFLITYSILALRNLRKHGNLWQKRSQPLSSRPLTVPTH